jgi:hypothetical protein
MVANQAYKTVLNDYINLSNGQIHRLWIDESKNWAFHYGTTTSRIHNLLKGYGIKSNKRCIKYKGKKNLPDLSILVTNLRREKIDSRMGTHWHWVVCAKEENKFITYDPYTGAIKPLDKTTKPASYIRIHT